MFASSLFLLASLAVSTVNAHGVLVAVKGANGVTGAGFGVIASTPRTGSTKNPFEQDTSIIRDNEVQSGKADACGRTTAGGNNDITTQLAAASAAGLPTMAADGTVEMTLHQVNGDGAGPYTCDASADGGQTWTQATVVTNVPGKNSRSNAKATDFPLVAQVNPNTACAAGPNGDACLVRCRNAANAGPFGGCVAVTGAGSGNATAAPAAAAPAAAAPAAAAPAAAGAAGTGAAPAAAAPAAGAAGTGAAPAAAAPAAGAAAGTGAAPAAAQPAAAGTAAGKTAAARVITKVQKKRFINSRIAGKRSGSWLDDVDNLDH